MRLARVLAIAIAVGIPVAPLLAVDPDRDFSGKWIFDPGTSDTRAIFPPQDRFLTITGQETAIRLAEGRPGGPPVEWTFNLDGADTRYKIGQESRNSKVKWEGNALLVNTIVTGPKNYTEMDRWIISTDHNVLSIERQILQNGSEAEGVLRYRREGAPPPVQEAAPPSAPSVRSNPRPTQPPTLLPPPTQTEPSQIVVKSGTRIPLSLRNAIDTKHSREGDRVYLDTTYPVVVNNRIVIPRGSYVIGTLTKSKPAGVVTGKGQLYIRFDSLTLANGTTRDFRARLSSAETSHGDVDRNEGTITGERDKAGAAKGTAEGAGIGAGIGGLAGAAAGHPLGGVGIGAAAGAAVGLASVLNKHRADVVLPRGTAVEMLLDRDLYYLPSELLR